MVVKNVKNGLKVKELAKQPPTLKTLIQKVLVGLWVKKLTFNIRKIVDFTYSLKKLLTINFQCSE